MGTSEARRGGAATGLRDEVQRLRGTSRAARSAIDLGPASAHEAVTRQMVEGVRDEVREVRTRVNALLFLVAGSALLEIVAGALAGGR